VCSQGIQIFALQDGKERPVQVMVVSEGEQAQVADEKTNLTSKCHHEA
jgi:hypothetical protein